VTFAPFIVTVGELPLSNRSSDRLSVTASVFPPTVAFGAGEKAIVGALVSYVASVLWSAQLLELSQMCAWMVLCPAFSVTVPTSVAAPPQPAPARSCR
jgi:hypothetical protein